MVIGKFHASFKSFVMEPVMRHPALCMSHKGVHLITVYFYFEKKMTQFESYLLRDHKAFTSLVSSV